MAYYSAAEMEKLLDNYPKFRGKLYCKGFLLTDKRVDNLADYPFYNNWKENIIVSGADYVMFHVRYNMDFLNSYKYIDDKNGNIQIGASYRF